MKHAIFVRPPDEPQKVMNLHKWKRVEKEADGAVRTSMLVQAFRIMRQFGAGTLANAPESRPDILQTIQEVTMSTARGLLTGTSHGNTVSYFAQMECWVLEHVGDVEEGEPESEIGRYISEIRRWESIGKLDPEHDEEEIKKEAARPIMPMPVSLVLMLYQACLRPKSELAGNVPGLARERTAKDGMRQIGFPTLNAFDQAITAMHKLCGLPSPTDDPVACKFRLDARKKHKTRHHQYLCFQSDLPLIHEAVMKHETWSNAEKVRNWTMLLFTAIGGRRKTEVGSYCPDVSDLSVPKDASNWEQKAPVFTEPKHLEIKQRIWKGHSEEEEATELIMWRNPADSRFCVVTWLIAWLAIAEHPLDANGKLKGPLFGKLTPKGRGKCTQMNQNILPASKKTLPVKVAGSTLPDVLVWETDEGRRVNLSEDDVESIGREANRCAQAICKRNMCKEADCGHDKCAQYRESLERLEESTYHAYRVGFAVWGARMGGEKGYVQTKLGGRWERLSEVFDIYWGHGESRRNKLRGERDPLLDQMPWPLQGFTFRSANAGSLFEMRQTPGRRGEVRGRQSGGGRREGVTGRPRVEVQAVLQGGESSA